VHFHTARALSLAPYARASGATLVVTRRMDYVPSPVFAPWLYNHAVDAVIAISQGVADALARAGVVRDRIRIVPSGVDCDRFRPATESERAAARSALGVAAEELLLVSVGTLEKRK